MRVKPSPDGPRPHSVAIRVGDLIQQESWILLEKLFPVGQLSAMHAIVDSP
jgi:hypothetical protein